MNRIQLNNTRPGGECLAAARRAGAPFSPFDAIKESGMLQRHRCVSVSCDRCAGHCEHFPTPGAALRAVAALGWRLIEARLLCPSCQLAVQCAAQGHAFTVWYQPHDCGCAHSPGTHLGGRQGCGLEARHCTRCGRRQSQPSGTVLWVVA